MASLEVGSLIGRVAAAREWFWPRLGASGAPLSVWQHTHTHIHTAAVPIDPCGLTRSRRTPGVGRFVCSDRNDDQAGATTAGPRVVGVIAPIGASAHQALFCTGAHRNLTAGSMAGGSTPAGTPTSATGAAQAGGRAPGDRITDAGAFASASDKLSLVCREVVLGNVRVVRVVGPKSFTLASGSEELVVMIDQGLSRGVGTQGQIEPGNTLSLKGNFQRLEQDEISNISNSRFRDLTEQKLETLRKTEVYLHATEFSKVN